jgi:hypothetical protein
MELDQCRVGAKDGRHRCELDAEVRSVAPVPLMLNPLSPFPPKSLDADLHNFSPVLVVIELRGQIPK